MQTEKAKSSQFDRTRGDKKQIFPTYFSSKSQIDCTLEKILKTYKIKHNDNFEKFLNVKLC